jgi:hypothetical protein
VSPGTSTELYKNLTGPDGFGAGGVLIVPD